MLPVLLHANITACVTTIGENMMALLLLDDDVQKKNEICELFCNAGYRVNWGVEPGWSSAGAYRHTLEKSIVILQVDHTHPLPMYAAGLTGGVSPPWRLSLHQHCLVAPNGNRSKLTSLEFTLVKLFALTERGEVVPRKRIIDEFGEHYLSYDQNRLDTTVTRLRKKVRSRLGMDLPLNTVRVRGFSFDDWLVIDN
jgi:hypothetical protein